MKRTVSILVCAVWVGITGTLASAVVPRPKIVVCLVVDQMRWDYLYRFYDRYGDGGFKRLLTDGFSCDQTLISYAPTVTGCGHASIFTGATPAVHGIVGNDWPDFEKGYSVNCVGDENVSSVGTESKYGKASPRNLLTTTVGDELKIATNFRSKVVGISIKDRAAILPAGHTADAAFWFDKTNNCFITSTYYMDELPEWVQSFNNRKIPQKYLKQGWNTLYPVASYVQSTADDMPYESRFANERRPVFPHRLVDSVTGFDVGISNTPFGNNLVLAFAKEAIQAYQLGTHGDTDLLTVSLSSPDAIGHRFGPNSIEIEDNYLRLDKELEAFFAYLDQTFGEGDYLFFITADHGASQSPGYLAANKLPFGFLNEKYLLDSIQNVIRSEYGLDSVIAANANQQLYLNDKAISRLTVSKDEIADRIVMLLMESPGITDAFVTRKLGSATLAEPIKTMMINGYHLKRGGDIVYSVQSGWKWGSISGASHSHWNAYDAHIPLIWMGWGVQPGKTNRLVHNTDIAATLASLLHIQMPSGNVGSVIYELTDH
jgi:Uncharacterized proteins of the AP superfamily